MKKTMAMATSAALLVFTAACGGGGRPSVDELSEALTSEDNVFGAVLDGDQADCAAEALVDSDLSDDTLQAIVDGDEDYEGSDDEQDKLDGLSTDLGACVSE
ncbi:hypothetical protein [Aeromicrobium sp. Sec7.5]|uniref:hypothetical protein n=1 Tax=Aeromicrobium sp. Sec7.5 TaxID=3121276 RepID=UPI002FE434A9